MQQYEVAILYHPDLEIDLGKASKRVEKIFAEMMASPLPKIGPTREELIETAKVAVAD